MVIFVCERKSRFERPKRASKLHITEKCKLFAPKQKLFAVEIGIESLKPRSGSVAQSHSQTVGLISKRIIIISVNAAQTAIKLIYIIYFFMKSR
jgi:hypothetical protein